MRPSWGVNAFNEHLRGIVQAQNLEVIGAEDRFWAANAANNVSLEQVLFGQFHRMAVIGWFIDAEGSSSHDYHNGHTSEMVLCPILWGIILSHIYAREVR